MEAGTLQGGPLSSFLWNIFINPLLRWLEVGNHGYKFATSKVNVASNAYADDLKLLSSKRRNSQIQMTKGARFAAWSGLTVNLNKCAYTALSKGCQGLDEPPLPFSTDLNKSPHINSVYIPWLSPSASYCYLGIELTATRSWQSDITDCLATAANKCNAIMAAPYFYHQKLMLMRDNAVMAAAYKLEAGGFMPSSAAKIDKQIARWAKETIGASKSTAGAFIFLPRDLYGWGMRSVRKELTNTYTRVLLQSLRNPDKLGLVKIK